MRTLLCSLLLVGCVEKLPVTAPGTALFEWESTRASRVPVRTATIGARKSIDKRITVTEGDAPFVVDLHIESAEIDFEEDGKKVHQVSPVLLRAKVANNEHWQLTGKCEDGPHYQMPSVGAGNALVTPLGMVQSCSITHHRNAGMVLRSEYRLGVSLQIYADGKISALPPDRVKIE
jgi:hypothetical protein